MLSQVRWQAEQQLMQRAFGEGFTPFVDEKFAGFFGHLRGSRGQVYEVEIRAKIKNYPQSAPKVFIRPRVGSNYLWDGSLCVNHPWQPARGSFAQQILYAAAYIKEKE